MAGYVFSAALDYDLSHNGYEPGPCPSLRLLSTLLPWKVPDPVGPLGPGSASLTVSLLWRIPLFFGNPAPFYTQALEPYLFNAVGLGMLLATSFKHEYARIPWGKLMVLEALLGLALVLPADLWMMQGLQGVFQFHSIVIPLGTLRLLDPPTFFFNILTGVLIFVALGSAAATRTRRG